MSAIGGGTIRDLFSTLTIDTWREQNPFSDPLEKVNEVLFHPYAEDADRIEVMDLWLQRHQPCLFGKIAAKEGLLHYCFIYDEDIVEGNDRVSSKISEELKAWKRRSVNPSASAIAHGFVLVVASRRVSLARPDDVLKRFSNEVLNLWGCEQTHGTHGIMHWETLYLKNPYDSSFNRFRFSVDFFAAAGDGRWWQDHRMPGGIAFTANSVGHMRRCREWYQGLEDQRIWVLKNAMRTIAGAAKTPYGQATRLRELKVGEPMVEEVICPFANPELLQSELKGKDWTRYAGYLHTDQSVRDIFFRDDPAMSKEIMRKEWSQDLTYIYDNKTHDHIQFMHGEPISADDVFDVIGKPEEYVQTISPKRRVKEEAPSDHSAITGDPQMEELDQLLAQCRKWTLTDEEVDAF